MHSFMHVCTACRRSEREAFMRPAKKSLWAFLFAAYALVMLWLLYGQRARIVFPSAGAYYGDYLLRLRQTYNLVPFKTVVSFIRLLTASRSAYLVRHAFVNLAGNIVLFVPLGLFLPHFFRSCAALADLSARRRPSSRRSSFCNGSRSWAVRISMI